MIKIPFKNGVKSKNAYVTIDGTNHDVTDAEYTGETPLSAENLNQMQENIEKSVVSVSSIEPTTSEKVWFRKTKNVFNFNSIIPNYISKCSQPANINADYTNKKFTITNWNNNSYFPRIWPDLEVLSDLGYINLLTNTTYTLTLNSSNIDYLNVQIYYLDTTTNTYKMLKEAAKSEEITFTTNEFKKWIIRFCSIGASGSTLTISKIQLELGSATAYGEYVENKILVKNANGDFEKFSDTVSVDSKEPNTGVWFRKTKNLFNKNSYSSVACQIVEDTMLTNTDCDVIILPILSNQTYTISRITLGARFVVGFTDVYPANNVAVSSKIQNNTATSLTITATSTNKYLVIWYYHKSYDTDKQAILDGLMVECDTVASTYESYVEDTIMIKNKGGVYENFMPVRKIQASEFFTSTNYTVGEFEVYQQGNFINIQRILFNNVKVSKAETVLGAINSKFIPKSKKAIRILGSTGSSAIDCICFITGSGSFTTIHYDTPATGENGVYVFNTSYIVE